MIAATAIELLVKQVWYRTLEGMRVLANGFAASFSLWDFDLSRSESLRTLEVPGSCNLSIAQMAPPLFSSPFLDYHSLCVLRDRRPL